MASSLASQSKLTDLTKKFDGKTPVRIHFLDNSSKVFLAEKSTTVKDILLQCLQKSGIVDPTTNLPYFGLFESKNGGSIDGVLEMEATIPDILERWNDTGVQQTAKFLFMIRLYLPCLWGLQLRDVVAFRLNKPKSVVPLDMYLSEAELVDVNVMHLQFIQAVYNVITGRYPTTLEQALDLGAIHFIYKFGEFKPQTHQPGFLGNRIVEFIPIKHLRSGATSITDWEQNLLSRVKNYAAAAAHYGDKGADGNGANGDSGEEGEGEGHAEENAENSSNGEDSGAKKTVYFRRHGKPLPPQRKYMEQIYSMTPTYGCSFYRCTQHSCRLLPDTVQLGVHHHGLGVFDKTKKLVRGFHIEDIFRWGFKPNQMFYFEINEENDLGAGSLEFDTVEGKAISDLLTDYAMAFLKEREREDARHEQMKAGTFDVKSTHSKSNLVAGMSDTPNAGNGPPPPPPPPPSSRAVDGAPPPPPPPTHAASGTAEEHEAAVRMQALMRGYMLRNDWAREDAAILMQSIYRGYRARVLVGNMIETMIREGDL
mmetsp:Transcript_25912/g.43544  ORF Transcript_25912/g.43544 Transcript_25912/m.43544 type:complete len:538 (-) Transcript_25912:187-1800(-)